MKTTRILYHFESCRFCQKVRQFIAENGLEIEQRDIEIFPQYAIELMALGGKTQVPCLSIDGVALYESMDIIDWLRQNLVKAN